MSSANDGLLLAHADSALERRERIFIRFGFIESVRISPGLHILWARTPSHP